MEWNTIPVTTNPIDAHLATLPQPQRNTLAALRDVLRELLPGAQECISYNMPCFKVDGVAVAGFEGFKGHCSYFPHGGNVVERVAGVPAWCTASSKGTLQFPIDRPLPKALVKQLVLARQAEIAEKATPKRVW